MPDVVWEFVPDCRMVGQGGKKALARWLCFERRALKQTSVPSADFNIVCFVSGFGWRAITE